MRRGCIAAWGCGCRFLRPLPYHPRYFSCCGATLEETPSFLAMKKHPTASEDLPGPATGASSFSADDRDPDHTTFYFVTVIRRPFADRAEAPQPGLLS